MMRHAFRMRIVKLLLFFYLFSSYHGAVHIHKDTLASHDDCKVCIVVKNLHSGDVPAAFVEPFVAWDTVLVVSLWHDAVVAPFDKGFDAHAPPRFS